MAAQRGRGGGQSEVLRRIAAKWKALDAVGRQPFVAQSEADKQRRARECASLGPARRTPLRRKSVRCRCVALFSARAPSLFAARARGAAHSGRCGVLLTHPSLLARGPRQAPRCVCGSTTHKRRTHAACPLSRSRNLGVVLSPNNKALQRVRRKQVAHGLHCLCGSSTHRYRSSSACPLSKERNDGVLREPTAAMAAATKQRAAIAATRLRAARPAAAPVATRAAASGAAAAAAGAAAAAALAASRPAASAAASPRHSAPRRRKRARASVWSVGPGRRAKAPRIFDM